jgi:uncharacterized sulfatase
VALVVRVPGRRDARVIDDLVRLPDLAPTFMEVAGVTPPAGLYGRTLLPLLETGKSGQNDPANDWVITGRERHVGTAREWNLPYPMRALRTPDYVYIRNFEPDRWPMGAPKEVTTDSAPAAAVLENSTYAAFADMDASPTKAWVILHRGEQEWSNFYQRAFGKRPAEELYDVRKDPDMLNNLAGNTDFAAVKERYAKRLMDELRRAGDPRVVENPPRFERLPFTEAVPAAPKKEDPAPLP